MTFKFIHNYLASPLLIYDGPEPKTIPFMIKNQKGGNICKTDLWNDATYSWREWFPDKSAVNLCDFLKFPKKDVLYENQAVAHIEAGPIYISKCEVKDQKYYTYYTIFEKQPSRYQCYVLATFFVS